MKNTIAGAFASSTTGRPADAQPANRFVGAELLPAAAYFPDTPALGVQFISQVRSGLLPAEAQQQVRTLAAILDLSLTEMAAVLATSERTFARRLGTQDADKIAPLTKAQSERLFLLKEVGAHGLAVFEDQGKFNRWLRRPLPLLGHQSPLQLLDTVTGFGLVNQLLGRIEHGVYS